MTPQPETNQTAAEGQKGWSFIPETYDQSAAVYDERGHILADIHGPDEERCTGRARLIAAAPELLSALEKMVNVFGRNTVEGTIGDAACNQSRAAISKAKDQQ